MPNAFRHNLINKSIQYGVESMDAPSTSWLWSKMGSKPESIVSICILI